MQTYQLQETKTFNVVLLIPSTFIYLLKITKKNRQYSRIYIKSKEPISQEVVVIKILKLEAMIFPGCGRSLHLEYSSLNEKNISWSGTKYNTKKNLEPNTRKYSNVAQSPEPAISKC